MAVKNYLTKQNNYEQVILLVTELLEEELPADETESADELFEKLINAQVPLNSKSVKRQIMQLMVSNEIVNKDQV